jgi:hypothetical protein
MMKQRKDISEEVKKDISCHSVFAVMIYVEAAAHTNVLRTEGTSERGTHTL